MAASEWKVPFLPVKPWQMTLVVLSIRMDIQVAFVRSLRPLVNAGKHVGPPFGVGRILNFHGVGVGVDDLVDVAGDAAQRAADQRQALVLPAAGGGRLRE